MGRSDALRAFCRFCSCPLMNAHSPLSLADEKKIKQRQIKNGSSPRFRHQYPCIQTEYSNGCNNKATNDKKSIHKNT